MLQRGNVAPPTAARELLGRPPRAASDFSCPPTRPMRARRRRSALLPLLRASVALVWIVTGIVSLGIYPVEQSYELLARTGVPGACAPLALYGAALLDLVLGVATLAAASAALAVAGADRAHRRLHRDHQRAPAGVLAASLRADPEEPAHARAAAAAARARLAAKEPRRWTYVIGKWLHILSSTLLFGTGLGSAYYMFFTCLRGDARMVAHVARLVVVADWMFTATTIVLQPLTGLWLVHLAGLPLTSRWIVWTFVLYFVAGACWIPVVLIQIRMRRLAEAAAAQASRCRRRSGAVPLVDGARRAGVLRAGDRLLADGRQAGATFRCRAVRRGTRVAGRSQASTSGANPMQSKARFLGHPVHQMLVVFPLGPAGHVGGLRRYCTRALDAPTFAVVAFWMIVAGVVGGLDRRTVRRRRLARGFQAVYSRARRHLARCTARATCWSRVLFARQRVAARGRAGRAAGDRLRAVDHRRAHRPRDGLARRRVGDAPGRRGSRARGHRRAEFARRAPRLSARAICGAAEAGENQRQCLRNRVDHAAGTHITSPASCWSSSGVRPKSCAPSSGRDRGARREGQERAEHRMQRCEEKAENGRAGPAARARRPSSACQKRRRRRAADVLQPVHALGGERGPVDGRGMCQTQSARPCSTVDTARRVRAPRAAPAGACPRSGRARPRQRPDGGDDRGAERQQRRGHHHQQVVLQHVRREQTSPSACSGVSSPAASVSSPRRSRRAAPARHDLRPPAPPPEPGRAQVEPAATSASERQGLPRIEAPGAEPRASSWAAPGVASKRQQTRPRRVIARTVEHEAGGALDQDHERRTGLAEHTGHGEQRGVAPAGWRRDPSAARFAKHATAGSRRPARPPACAATPATRWKPRAQASVPARS